MNIHEYANELICIFEYQIKWHSLSLFSKLCLSKTEIWFYCVYCQNSICFINGKILFSPNEFFLEDIFSLI